MDGIEVCLICNRTDAFTPGTITHDPALHKTVTDAQARAAKEKKRGANRNAFFRDLRLLKSMAPKKVLYRLVKV